MTFLDRIRLSSLALCAVCAFSMPVSAQQRFQIGEIVQRIDRLETEVTRLRVSPGSGGSDAPRLDQIEQELRRLTGIIERLDFESRRAATATDKRLDSFDDRLATVESGRGASASRPSVTTDSSFSSSTSGQAPVASGFPVAIDPAPTYQPQTDFQPQAQPQLDQPQVAMQQPFAPSAQPSGFQNADALYDEGVRLLNVGQFDQAGASFESLIAAHPQHPKAGQAQFWLGDMHFKLGRYEQAASAFLDSFRNWPEGAKAPDSLLKLGMTLANIGKTEEACLSFKQVAARYPTAPASLLRRADIEGQRYRCS